MLSQLVVLVHSQYYPFCTNGISAPDFVLDHGKPSVDVIVAQTPLFSTNPSFGQKLGLFGLYHTAIVLSQEYVACNNGTSGCFPVRRNWTLEFDYTGGSIIKGIMPKILGNTLRWDNNARFCLTQGVLWGRGHWTKSFDTAMRITAEQANQTFQDFVYPVNSTSGGPQYQLWRVVQERWFGQFRQTLVMDTTCSDGASWFLHHVATVLGVTPRPGFKLKGTVALVNADHISLVNRSDPREWHDVVQYYEQFVGLSANITIAAKLVDLLGLVPMKFMYDTNAGTYYQIFGNHFPWFRIEYQDFPLSSPPTSMTFSPAREVFSDIGASLLV